MQKKQFTIENYINARRNEGKDLFYVPASLDIAGYLMETGKSLWEALGNFESVYWNDTINTTINKPVYICGLARSGTTILLEMLYGTGLFASHLYQDYPFIDIPILWNQWLKLILSSKQDARERSHMDGILVTPNSPEALEEIIWMSFFSNCHDPSVSNVIDKQIKNNKFDTYYIKHIKKLLWVRQKNRYLAKGNYNFTRIDYLRQLFSDINIIIPIRDPVSHIASLVKQHQLFCIYEARDRRVSRYLRRIGHFEFGLNRVPINTGDYKAIDQIKKAWSEGKEIEGWILYYKLLHQWLFTVLKDDEELRKSVYLASYSALCESSEEELNKIFCFCGISDSSQYINRYANILKTPSYYTSGFDNNTIKKIESQTFDVYHSLLQLI